MNINKIKKYNKIQTRKQKHYHIAQKTTQNNSLKPSTAYIYLIISLSNLHAPIIIWAKICLVYTSNKAKSFKIHKLKRTL
jgi:hypothetical protein